MCGIVGMLAQNKPLAPGEMQAALAALAHRGPDGEAAWFSPNRMVGLGHRRLAIIDLETGQQPLSNEDGSIRLVVNGEFYDYERIRRELAARGHVFQTQSDSEIAVHLYEEFGLELMRELRGEFAFVLWDERRQRLVAARDRFGIKPLFYAVHDETLVLASEVKALFAAGIPAAWDCEALYRQLFLCYPPDHTMFRDIQQLPAGHLLVARHGELRRQCYWDFAFPRAARQSNHASRADEVAQTRALLEEAVRLRLRADVPVGVMLSGGLDSTALLGLATALGARPPTVFNIAFDVRQYDESETAETSARYFGAEFHSIRVTETDVVECMADAGWHGEMIQYNAHGTARYLLSRLIRDAGCKVVLGGEGADEVFAGYEIMQSAPLNPAQAQTRVPGMALLARLARPATPAQRAIAETSPWLARALKFTNVPPSLQAALAERMELLYGLLAPDFRAQYKRIDPYSELWRSIQGMRKLPGREYARQVTYVWLKTLFANYHLGADRLDMAHSVEVRLPYLDHHLFEHVSQLPMRVLAEPGREKALLREAAKPFLPPSIYNRPKKGFMAPPIDFDPNRPLNQFIQSVLRSRAASAVPFLNARAVTATLDAIPALPPRERAMLDPLLMQFASFVILQQRFRL